jgi:hypothetical protein
MLLATVYPIPVFASNPVNLTIVYPSRRKSGMLLSTRDSVKPHFPSPGGRAMGEDIS